MKKNWIIRGVDVCMFVFVLALVSAFVSIAAAVVIGVWREVLT